MSVQDKHKGALAETIAVSWLLSQGYDVFRNVSAHGLADLVAVNFDTNENILVDVKMRSPRNGLLLGRFLTDAQIKAGVRGIAVDDNLICHWYTEDLQTPSVTLKCRNCEDVFVTHIRNQKYCSKDCGRSYRIQGRLLGTP